MLLNNHINKIMSFSQMFSDLGKSGKLGCALFIKNVLPVLIFSASVVSCGGVGSSSRLTDDVDPFIGTDVTVMFFSEPMFRSGVYSLAPLTPRRGGIGVRVITIAIPLSRGSRIRILAVRASAIWAT